MNFEEIVDQFNDGEFDAELYFNDYNTFFNVLNKRDLISRVDIDNIDIQNHLLIYLYENNRAEFYEFVVSKLSDIDMDENGNIYLDLSERSELSGLFCERNSRNEISRDTIESVLGGNSEFYFYDTYEDVYLNVIRDLDSKNIKLLQEYIIESLKNEKIEPGTDELYIIADNQGHPEYLILDDLVTIQTIIDDEESMNYLLDNYLEDLNSDLRNIYSNAYNSAYEAMIYDDIWDELQTYVNGRGKDYIYPHRFKKDKMTERFRVPVASNFDNVILDYLDSNKNFGSRGLLEYWGDYIPIVANESDCLSVWGNDSPDYSRITENINEIFPDYI
jgi:hypothetical protein